MGSRSGDVDDGLAFLHLLARNVIFHGLFSVFGNTTAMQSMKNSNALFQAFRFSGRMEMGAGSPNDRVNPYQQYFASLEPSTEVEVLELGPLTNLANFLSLSAADKRPRIRCVRLMGTNISSRGKWPPIWPFEYNLTKDREATREVFSSGLPLLIFPLDVAKKFRLRRSDIMLGDGASTDWVMGHAARWFQRNRRLYFRPSIIAWDVLMAIHLTHPLLFSIEERLVTVDSRGVVSYGSGRPVQVVVDFDIEKVRAEFRQSLLSLKDVGSRH